MTFPLRSAAAIAALCLCAGSELPAQTNTTGPRAALTGQVLAVDSDTPLRRARVSVTAPFNWRSDIVLTDNEGRFAVLVPASGTGTLTLTIAKAGFVTAALKVERDAIQTPLLVRPPRASAISGIVVDASGTPAEAIAVTARRIGGTTEAPTQYSTTTDDLGEYRLSGLPRGRYEIWAGTAMTIPVIPPQAAGTKIAAVRSEVGAGEKTLLTLETAEEAGGVQLVAPDVEAVIDAMREGGQLPRNSLLSVLIGTTVVTLDDGVPARATPLSAGHASALSGRLLSASRRPVAKTPVRIEGPGVDRVVRTDASGVFSLLGLPPGQYTMRADVSERMSWHLGQRAPGEAGRPINLARDQVVQGIEIVLPPARVISGAVVDEHGEAVQGARVQAWQLQYSAGRTVAIAAGNARATDDRGRYRLWGLHPGSYLVSAFIDGFLPAGTAQTAYAKTYFPGTAIVGAAVPIELATDAVANIAFSPTGLTDVRGIARDGDGTLVGGTARLVENRRAGAVTEPRVVDLKPDGSFVFQHVPPGVYVLQVRGDGPGRTGLFGSQELIVGNEPATVIVPTSYGANVQGRILAEGQAEGVRVPVGIGTVALDDRAREPTTGVVVGSSEFFITNLFGHTALSLRGVSDEWFLKSWTVKGVDVVDVGYDFGSGPDEIDGSEIVLSRNGAVLTGLATDGLKPADDYFVVVFPASRDLRWPGSRRLKLVRSAFGGEFRASALPSGDYFVAAVSRVQGSRDGGEWQNPDLLLQLEARAERVTLTEGQTANVALRLIDR
jgi:hypothetical protein